MNATEAANLLYEYTLNVTSVTEYGVSFASLASGQVLPPPEGARFDIAFEGSASVEDYKWVNHLQVWALGTVDLARQVIHVKGYSAS